jgi:hypothetical protein
MVDQKVAVLVAVCLIIILFAWTPGMLVRRENYIATTTEEVNSGTPFRLKDGDKFVSFEASTGKFNKTGKSGLATYFRVVTDAEVSPGFRPIQMINIMSTTPPEKGKQYIRHRLGFIYTNDYEPGNVDFGWKFVPAGNDTVVITNNFVDSNKNRTGLQFRDGYLFNSTESSLTRFTVDMWGNKMDIIRPQEKPQQQPTYDGACAEEKRQVDTLRKEIRRLTDQQTTAIPNPTPSTKKKIEYSNNSNKSTSYYVQPNMDDQTMPISSDEIEPHEMCGGAMWWSSSCNMSSNLDYESTSETMLRPREQAPIDGVPLEYQPMSTEGSRRVLGTDGPKETLPMMNAWDNTNELSMEMGGSVSLDQTQLDQIRGNAAANRLEWNNLIPMQPMSQEVVA